MWVSGAAAKQSARDLLWLTQCIFLDSSHSCSEMPSLSTYRRTDSSMEALIWACHGDTAPTNTQIDGSGYKIHKTRNVYRILNRTRSHAPIQ